MCLDINIKRNLIGFQLSQSWIEKDIYKFKGLLHDDILVTEFFGASYVGKNKCELWFNHWNNTNLNQVIEWKTLNHYYDDLADISVFGWFFKYKYKGEEHYFTDVTLFKVNDNKIISLKEFESKTNTYRLFK